MWQGGFLFHIGISQNTILLILGSSHACSFPTWVTAWAIEAVVLPLFEFCSPPNLHIPLLSFKYTANKWQDSAYFVAGVRVSTDKLLLVIPQFGQLFKFFIHLLLPNLPLCWSRSKYDLNRGRTGNQTIYVQSDHYKKQFIWTRKTKKFKWVL